MKCARCGLVVMTCIKKMTPETSNSVSENQLGKIINEPPTVSKKVVMIGVLYLIII